MINRGFAMHAQTSSAPSIAAPLDGLEPHLCRLHAMTGQPIYVEGDPVGGIYKVVTGAVRTVRHSVEGRRQIGGFYFPGDLVGPDGADRHLFSAEAMCPSFLAVTPRGSPHFRDEAYQAVMEDLRRTHAHLAMLGRRSAEEKVASFLVEMAGYGAAETVTLPMNRQDMADYLGLAMETVCRILGQFQERGLVEFTTRRDFHILRGVALCRLAET